MIKRFLELCDKTWPIEGLPRHNITSNPLTDELMVSIFIDGDGIWQTFFIEEDELSDPDALVAWMQAEITKSKVSE